MSQFKKKFIGANQVSGDKILLDNAQAIRSKKFNSEDVVEIIKLNAQDKLELVQPPVIRTGPSTTVEVADKPSVDTLSGRVTAIENAKGAVNGYASLDAGGKIPSTQIPPIAITDVYVVATIAARDALQVQTGDVAKVTDSGNGRPRTYIYDGSQWREIEPSSDVVSVNNKIGAVTLTTSDINEGTNLYFTQERAKSAVVSDSVTDGVTDVAPSQNAVYDALALKLNTSGGSVSGNITLTGGATVKGLPDVPAADGDAASKKYVVDSIAAIPVPNLTNYATKTAVNTITIPVLSHEVIKITSAQETTKQVVLASTPSAGLPIMIAVDGIMLRPLKTVDGSPVGDFTVSGSTVDFTNCDPALAAGDLLQIYYMVDTHPAL